MACGTGLGGMVVLVGEAYNLHHVWEGVGIASCDLTDMAYGVVGGGWHRIFGGGGGGGVMAQHFPKIVQLKNISFMHTVLWLISS